MKSICALLVVALSLPALAGNPKPVVATAKTAAPAGTASTIIADVDGIVCAFCVQGIQKIFKSKGKAEEVVISLEQKKVFVTEKKGQSISDEEFRETIRQAGFKTRAITRSSLKLDEAKARLTAKQALPVETKSGKPVHTVAR